ncbi:MAG: lipid-A-disaccharide synthase [Chthoniobacterales bacterium]
MPTIYFVVGEASGDNHGAALMRELRELLPSIEFRGRGGPQMKAIAGDRFDNWTAEAGVLGLWEVIKKYAYFRTKFRQTIAEVNAAKPDAVLLIDYPGFNLRLARALRRGDHAPKIIYYISPQVWAWHRSRISQMARCVDLMLCIFPFEADLYNRSRLRTRFVGHPMIDRLSSERIEVNRQPELVGLFPGSREREVRKIFPVLIQVVKELRQRRPSLQFEVTAASPRLGTMMEQMIVADAAGIAGIEIKTGNSASLMQRAAAAVVASGSATLEAAYFRLPFVLVYKVAWLTYIAAKIVVRIPHLGMPNILAGSEIVPEFIQHRADPVAIATAVLRLIEEPSAKNRMLGELDAVVSKLGQGGASRVAAQEIIGEIAANGAPTIP